MKNKITLDYIKSLEPCSDGLARLYKTIGTDATDDRVITFDDVVQNNSCDLGWVVSKELFSVDQVFTYAMDNKFNRVLWDLANNKKLNETQISTLFTYAINNKLGGILWDLANNKKLNETQISTLFTYAIEDKFNRVLWDLAYNKKLTKTQIDLLLSYGVENNLNNSLLSNLAKYQELTEKQQNLINTCIN